MVHCCSTSRLPHREVPVPSGYFSGHAGGPTVLAERTGHLPWCRVPHDRLQPVGEHSGQWAYLTRSFSMGRSTPLLRYLVSRRDAKCPRRGVLQTPCLLDNINYVLPGLSRGEKIVSPHLAAKPNTTYGTYLQRSKGLILKLNTQTQTQTSCARVSRTILY